MDEVSKLMALFGLRLVSAKGSGKAVKGDSGAAHGEYARNGQQEIRGMG
jgi:hypothetical protein